VSSYIVTFLLFGLYLVVIPLGISPFEAPKVIIAEVLISLLLLVNILKFKKVDLKHFISPQTIFLAVLFLLALDQLLIFHPPGAFFGNPFRLQGIFLFFHLLIFSFISRDISLLIKESKLFYFLSFFCLVMGTIILGFNENNRAFGTLGEPNALAATALFIWPFIYFKGGRKIKIASFLACLLVIFLSGSRAGLIGFIIESIFISLVNVFKIVPLKAVLVSLVIALLTLVLPFTESTGLFEIRGQIWQVAISAGLKSPIIGYGFGNIQDPIYQTAVELKSSIQYSIIDSAHNFLLDFWIQGGAVAVISMLLLISLAISGLVKAKRIIELAAFLGLLTAMLFNPVSVVNLLAFWWLIGQGHHSLDKA